MKSTITLGLIFIFFGNLSAEEKENQTYKLVEKGSVENVQPYLKAIESANWKCYRMLNKSRTITFENGLSVELFSALEIAANGIVISKDCLVSEEAVKLITTPPIYRLDPSGRILEIHDSPAIKQTKKDKISK